jgi:hypothetical protein
VPDNCALTGEHRQGSYRDRSAPARAPADERAKSLTRSRLPALACTRAFPATSPMRSPIAPGLPGLPVPPTPCRPIPVPCLPACPTRRRSPFSLWRRFKGLKCGTESARQNVQKNERRAEHKSAHLSGITTRAWLATEVVSPSHACPHGIGRNFLGHRPAAVLAVLPERLYPLSIEIRRCP